MAKKRKKRIVARKRKRTTTERKGYELPLDVPTYMIDGREHFRLERGKYVPTEGAGSVAPLTDKGMSLIGDYSDSYSCAITTQLEQQIPMKKNGLLIVSIYDRSGVMIEPWREQKKNGRTINKGNVCVTIDLGDKLYSDDYKNCYHFSLDLLTTDPCSILSQFGDGTCDVLFAFPPCTDWSRAGTGSVKKKFWNDKFWIRRAMMLVDVARNWATHSKFWMIENPVGNLRRAWRKGNWKFEPFQYAGYVKGSVQQFLNYHTKETEIWANFPKPPMKYASFHGKAIPIPAKLKDWEFDVPQIRRPYPFDKPKDPTGKKKYREFAIVKQEVFSRYYPNDPWLKTWTPTKGLGIGREEEKAKREIHFWRSLLPSGFAQAIYKELHRIKVPTVVTEYQTSPMYTAPIAAPAKPVVKNPVSGILTPSQERQYKKIVKIVPLDERERLKAFAKRHAERTVGTVPQSYIDDVAREFKSMLRQYEYLDWWDERNPTKYEYASGLVRSYWGLHYLLKSDVPPLPDGSSFVVGTKIRKNGRNLGYGTKNGAMAKNQLQTIERTAQQLNEILQYDDQLPDWVLTKVSTAMDRLLSAYNYIQSKLQGMKQNPRVNVSAAIKNAQKVIQEIR